MLDKQIPKPRTAADLGFSPAQASSETPPRPHRLKVKTRTKESHVFLTLPYLAWMCLQKSSFLWHIRELAKIKAIRRDLGDTVDVLHQSTCYAADLKVASQQGTTVSTESKHIKAHQSTPPLAHLAACTTNHGFLRIPLSRTF